LHPQHRADSHLPPAPTGAGLRAELRGHPRTGAHVDSQPRPRLLGMGSPRPAARAGPWLPRGLSALGLPGRRPGVAALGPTPTPQMPTTPPTLRRPPIPDDLALAVAVLVAVALSRVVLVVLRLRALIPLVVLLWTAAVGALLARSALAVQLRLQLFDLVDRVELLLLAVEGHLADEPSRVVQVLRRRQQIRVVPDAVALLRAHCLVQLVPQTRGIVGAWREQGNAHCLAQGLHLRGLGVAVGRPRRGEDRCIRHPVRQRLAAHVIHPALDEAQAGL